MSENGVTPRADSFDDARTSRTSDRVFVEARGRLHFGVLDLRGSLGRWFGGIGAPAPAPTLLLSVEPSSALTADGPDAERAREFAQRFLERHGIAAGAHLTVHHALPAHAGLGSGTQLALAVARALAEMHALPTDVASLADAVGRARRSAIGTWTFAGGGLVVEGGRHRERDAAGPLLARIPLSATWQCVVACTDAGTGVSGDAEAAAFTALPEPPQHDVERVAHLALMALMPAAVEGDLPMFGQALETIQEITGAWFAPVQGGTFAPGATQELIRRLRSLGAVGVGQSSWGPTVYGFVEGMDAATHIAGALQPLLGDRGSVHHGPIPSTGARVWRG